MLTKFLGSEIFLKKKSFFYMYSLNGISIATILLCLDILVQEYTLALLPFIHHGSYCYSTIQLKILDCCTSRKYCSNIYCTNQNKTLHILYKVSDPWNQFTYVLADLIPTSPSGSDTRDQRRRGIKRTNRK